MRIVAHNFIPSGSLPALTEALEDAARRSADLVVFPEAAVTGLINDDNPVHDFLLAEEISDGPIARCIREACRRHHFAAVIGLLEKEGTQLFDTALFVDETGTILSRYRRWSPGWHGAKADPRVYRQGELPAPFSWRGRKLCLGICGDFYDNTFLLHVKALRPDLFVHILARALAPGRAPIEWDGIELLEYQARTQAMACPSLFCNAYEPGEGYFGGSLLVSANGGILARTPVDSPVALVVQLEC